MSANGEYVKKAFSIPADLWASVEELLAGGSQSGYVVRALRNQVEQDNIAALLSDMEAANGPVSPADRAAFEQELQAA